ncbi:unnamed protein product [Rotaria magnacalcarata]|uniref:Uncharacterized protein n=1 Tax=Rotaria magnacalcarata TaxID=392030 RepID=A0A816LVU5_9BILA|nr:unnamed protein product [Rotaria magnacalcarata]CAF3751298.1 unnamed protein product [Rotaria magnacalcarata]CAF3925439.1 unnamed protein product [Rotaria magnacalcarata]
MLNAIPDRCAENAKRRGLLRANEIFPGDSEDNIIPQQSLALSLRQESSLTLSKHDSNSTLEIPKRNHVVDMGTDINPAVSISMLSLRSITPLQCITYIIACMHLKKTRHKTIVVTSLESTEALLLIAIYVLSNKRNKLVANAQVPIAVGFVIVAIGYNCGFPINPARDLAPRLFTPFVDYETEVFSVGNYYFWIPCIGPIFGRLAGTWIYYGYSKLMEKHIGEEDIETARIRNQIDSSSEARL